MSPQYSKATGNYEIVTETLNGWGADCGERSR